MKKIILIIAICFAGHGCFAQFNATLVVNPTPPASLIDWDNKTLTYAVSSPVGLSRHALIKTTLKTADGTLVAGTNLAKAREVMVGGGTNLFYPQDVLPLEVMVFNGKFKTTLDKTGKLQANSYQLCVQLVTPVDFLPLSTETCRIFTIAAFQLPIPTMPANEEVLDADKAQTAIMFRWTPVSPRPSQPLRYIVKVFEVLEHQTPMQAFRSNQPLLSKEVIGTTQFIWQPQLAFNSSGQNDSAYPRETTTWGDPHEHTGDELAIDSIDAFRFTWTIQTVDTKGVPFGDGNINGDGTSEPNVFTVIRDRRKIRSGPPSRVIYLNKISANRN